VYNTPNQNGGAAYQPGIDQAQTAAQQVTDQARQAAEQMQQQAITQADRQKDQATKSLSDVAQAMRHAGDHLRQRDQGAIAQVADMAADRFEDAAGYLRGHDVNDLLDSVEDFAQRQPAIFLTGAFAFGLLATRFLKSSGQRRQGRAYSRSQAMPYGRLNYYQDTPGYPAGTAYDYQTSPTIPARGLPQH
jgi:hypothetical protein